MFFLVKPFWFLSLPQRLAPFLISALCALFPPIAMLLDRYNDTKVVGHADDIAPQLPEWFLRHRVWTATELASAHPRVRVGDEVVDDDPLPREGYNRTYEMHPSVYRPLLNLVRPRKPVEKAGRQARTGRRFAREAVFVRGHGQDFLQQTVMKFAKDIEADLVFITPNDIEDLSEHFLSDINLSRYGKETTKSAAELLLEQNHDSDMRPIHLEEWLPVGILRECLHKPLAAIMLVCTYLSAFFPKLVASYLLVHVPRRARSTLFLKRLMSAPVIKGSRPGGKSVNRLTIIALDGIKGFADMVPQMVLLQQIIDAVKRNFPAGSSLLVEFQESPLCLCPACIPEQNVKTLLGGNQLTLSVSVFPNQLFGKDLDFGSRKATLDDNVRRISRNVRRETLDFTLPWAQPFCFWPWLERSPAKRILETEALDDPYLMSLVFDISSTRTPEMAFESFAERYGRGSSYHEEGSDNDKESDGDKEYDNDDKSNNDDKSDGETEDVQDEFGILSCVVNLDEISESWSDIELEPETKRAVMQMASLMGSLPPEAEKSRYIQRSRGGGALLYGPPGTGKTHLARIFAKDSSATIFRISGGDILRSEAGDSEQRIQALFHHAQMRSPSIIFIDEADSLFRQRSSRDQRWEVSLTNQFLDEMSKVKVASPFSPVSVLLATNHPDQLDTAVLRRVPKRLYIGPPTTRAREAIFRICLKQEPLHQDVDIGELARITKGYTGSDIDYVCGQAALISLQEMQDRNGPEREDEKNQIADTKFSTSMSHFRSAIAKNSPTVSRSSAALKKFASQFDRVALEQMERGDGNSRDIRPPENTRPDLRRTEPSKDIAIRTKISQIGSLMVEPPHIQPPEHQAGTGKEEDSWADSEQTAMSEEPTIQPQDIYQSLDREKRDIRLIEICSDGSDGGQIECQLHMVSLSDNPIFSALSYVWGDSSDTETILLNGKPKRVTRNLHQVLGWVRKHWIKQFPGRDVGEFRLWVDAISINQEDLTEQNHQVKLMSDIYSGAQITFGAMLDDDSNLSIDMVLINRVWARLQLADSPISLSELSDGSWLRRMDLELREELLKSGFQISPTEEGSECEDMTEEGSVYDDILEEESGSEDTTEEGSEYDDIMGEENESEDTTDNGSEIEDLIERGAENEDFRKTRDDRTRMSWDEEANTVKVDLAGLKRGDAVSFRPTSGLMLSLLGIQRQSYWQRIWILQEAAMSRRMLLITNEASVDLSKVLNLRAVLRMPGDLQGISQNLMMDKMGFCSDCHGDLHSTSNYAWELVELAQTPLNQGRQCCGIAMILSKLVHSGLDASNARDLVYGLIGMFQINIEVDYRKPVYEVHADLIRAEMELPPFRACEHVALGRLHFLIEAGIDHSHDNGNVNDNQVRPSWVPRLILKHRRLLCWFEHHLFRSLRNFPDELHPKICGRVLTVQGQQIERVKTACSPVSYHKGLEKETLSVSALDIIRSYFLADHHENHSPTTTPLQTIFRTLFGHSEAIDYEFFGVSLNFFLELELFDQDVNSKFKDGSYFLRLLQRDLCLPKRDKTSGLGRKDYIDWFSEHFDAPTDVEKEFWGKCFPEIFDESKALRALGFLKDKSLLSLDGGDLALSVPEVRDDDIICLIYGFSLPAVLRPVADRVVEADGDDQISSYQFVGPCFSWNILQRARAPDFTLDEEQVREFRIV